MPFPEKNSSSFGIVISGVSVGMETRSKISPSSFPIAHTIFVPPASNAPNNMLYLPPLLV